jgi:hypothetical protein
MGLKEYREKKQKKPGRHRTVPVLVAVAVIVLIVVALAFYNRAAAETSNTVYCGVFQYLIFPASSVVGASTSIVKETMTTAVSFTTSTSITGRVGHTYSNQTSTINIDTVASLTTTAGVETICKYISDTSTSSSS